MAQGDSSSCPFPALTPAMPGLCPLHPTAAHSGDQTGADPPSIPHPSPIPAQPHTGHSSAAPCLRRASLGETLGTGGRRRMNPEPSSIPALRPPHSSPEAERLPPLSIHPRATVQPSTYLPWLEEVAEGAGLRLSPRLSKLGWPRLLLALPSLLSASPNPLCNLLMHGQSSCLRHGKSRIMRASSPLRSSRGIWLRWNVSTAGMERQRGGTGAAEAVLPKWGCEGRVGPWGTGGEKWWDTAAAQKGCCCLHPCHSPSCNHIPASI